MKKMILALPMLAGTLFANAQNNAAESYMHLGFGIKGGYNNANLSVKDNGEVQDKNSISSFNVGAYLDLPLAPVLSIQPGLMVTGKGMKYTIGDKSSANWYESKANPIYLELPINVVGKIPFGPNNNIFVGAGPYAAMGIAGKNTTNGQVLGVDFSSSDNIEYGNDDPSQGNNGSSNTGTIKKFDFGINLMAGVEISHFTFNANYGIGFANIKPGSSNNDNDKYKNRVFSLSVGFLF